MAHIVGIDIGGANLKAAHVDGRCLSRPFAVWKEPDRLAAELQQLLAPFGRIDQLGVTMTAELADCFSTKAEGVRRILDAVAECTDLERIHVWQTAGESVDLHTARDFPRLTAAANWHALATWTARLLPNGTGLLIDIGTTTTDLIPLRHGMPAATGLTDPERLASSELVYTGVRRTPLCALAERAPWRGLECGVAAELFATTLDVWLTLGKIAEDAGDVETADGRSATFDHSRGRLARMICADTDEFTTEDARTMAQFFADQQLRNIRRAVDRVADVFAEPFQHVVLSGSGGFLGEMIAEKSPALAGAEIHSLQRMLPLGASESACAFAVARLVQERC